MSSPTASSAIRRYSLAVVDLFLLMAAWYLAYFVRFEAQGGVPSYPADDYAQQRAVLMFFIAAAHVGLLLAFGFYRGVVRYVGIREFKGAAIATALNIVGFFVFNLIVEGRPDFFDLPVSIDGDQTRVFRVPTMIFPIYGVIGFILILGFRAVLRVVYESRHSVDEDAPATLIVGAGDLAENALREMRRSEDAGYRPVCAVAEDPSRVGTSIQGVRVRGGIADIPQLLDAHQIEAVLIALDDDDPAVLREVVRHCQDAKIAFHIIPTLREIQSGRVDVRPVRRIEVHDLLGREPVDLRLPEGRNYLRDEVVLITGAGGSIGSELCRQVAWSGPRRLVLLGKGENSIHEIAQELRRSYPALDTVSIIADVRDEVSMSRVFDTHRPGIVFHAAAHKHVPLMEPQPGEAVRNNVLGTAVVAWLAHQSGSKRFVMISTDKAVRPTSVMGASKRLAEMVVFGLAQESPTIFAAVRFGNVLGSRGSVIPLFEKQIAAGGPVTVTHPEVTRFFMTIPEAVSLVLQAGSREQNGALYLLDMGKPVKVLDLVKNMITLSGLKPGTDIAIEFTGLRAGEKLHEELLTEQEGATATEFGKVFTAKPARVSSWAEMRGHLKELRELTDGEDTLPLLRRMRDLIGDYHISALPEQSDSEALGIVAARAQGLVTTNAARIREELGIVGRVASEGSQADLFGEDAPPAVDAGFGEEPEEMEVHENGVASVPDLFDSMFESAEVESPEEPETGFPSAGLSNHEPPRFSDESIAHYELLHEGESLVAEEALPSSDLFDAGLEEELAAAVAPPPEPPVTPPNLPGESHLAEEIVEVPAAEAPVESTNTPAVEGEPISGSLAGDEALTPVLSNAQDNPGAATGENSGASEAFQEVAVPEEPVANKDTEPPVGDSAAEGIATEDAASGTPAESPEISEPIAAESQPEPFRPLETEQPELFGDLGAGEQTSPVEEAPAEQVAEPEPQPMAEAPDADDLFTAAPADETEDSGVSPGDSPGEHEPPAPHDESIGGDEGVPGELHPLQETQDPSMTQAQGQQTGAQKSETITGCAFLALLEGVSPQQRKEFFQHLATRVEPNSRLILSGISDISVLPESLRAKTVLLDAAIAATPAKWNAAAKLAPEGSLLIGVGATIRLNPDFCARVRDFANANPESPLFYADHILDQGGKESPQKLHDHQGCPHERFDFGHVMIYRASAIIGAGGFDESLKHAWEYDMHLRLMQEGLFLRITPALYRVVEPPKEETKSGALHSPGRGTLGGFSYVFYPEDVEKEVTTVFEKALKQIGAWIDHPPALVPQPATKPEVMATVVIPVLNRVKFVANAIQKVLDGTYQDFEIILIDNGSTDGTIDVIKGFSAKDPRVKLIHGSGGTIASALNEGIRAARGKYICQLDSDDEYAPTTLEKMIGHLESHPYCGLAISYYCLMNEHGEIITDIKPVTHSGYTRNQILRRDGGGALRVWPKLVMEEFGLYDEVHYGNFGEDYDLVVKTGEKYDVDRVHEVLYHYRRHSDNTDVIRDPDMKYNNKNRARQQALHRRMAINARLGKK